MNCKKKITTGTALALAIAFVAVGLLLGVPAASAVDNGPTETGQICMQKVFGTPVTSSNKLNCTANDIRLSRAISVSPTTCRLNEHFDLTATFETIVTASARYDAGFFFRIDGGPNARGDGSSASGQCSLSGLTPGSGPSLNLDGDTCGDLNSGTYNVTFTIPQVLCQDTDGDGLLNLPNCTSWHNNAGTACSITGGDLSQFDFRPDTKSKCVCDDTFQVPVEVETARVDVVKTASPTHVPETGGTVTYTVQVTNTASFVTLTINSITDNLYGNLGTNTPPLANNTCPSKIGTVLAAGGTTSCTFDAFVTGNSGDLVVDIAEVCGTDSGGHPGLCGHDDAVVDITDVVSEPTLEKNATSAANCQFDATYTVSVSNHSTIDTLTVNSLTDDKFGDITTIHAAGGGFAEVLSTTCGKAVAQGGPGTLPATIGTQGNYPCSFVGRVVSASCDFSHTNIATAGVRDSDGVSRTPSDNATVTVRVTIP